MLRWPSARDRFPDSDWRNAVQRGRYRLRLLLSSQLRAGFLEELSRLPAWNELYRREPACFYAPLRHFLDRRFGMPDRFEKALADLKAADARFGPVLASRLGRGEGVGLWSLEDGGCRLELGLNEVGWSEGHWALNLRDAAGRRLYHLSFAFLPGDGLLIGAVQGPRNGVLDSEAVVRDLTKSAEGLRPPHLLIEALRTAARAWGIRLLLGIDPGHHIKSRWDGRCAKLRFDYRRFWAEVGGVQRSDGYWDVPLQAQTRDLVEVPSRKRAMYRRRHALLTEMEQALQERLGGRRR